MYFDQRYQFMLENVFYMVSNMFVWGVGVQGYIEKNVFFVNVKIVV